VALGTARSFAVLAGSGITNTGATTITGDVGTFPTTSQTGFGSVTLNGSNHHGDSVTQGAKTDLVTAYNDAAGRTPATAIAVELGGKTLLAGVYRSGTFGLTGTLTLDAKGNPDADFIFQAGSTVTTATDSKVVLVNKANPCHVVWQVSSSATFGARTHFAGTVLALTSISAKDGATFRGRLLARDGAVTLIHNTISNAGCTATAAVGSGGSPAATPTASGSPASAAASASASASAGSGRRTSSATSGGPGLPFTGNHTGVLGLTGLGLLVAGTGGMIVGRRRQPTALPRSRGAHRA
jgi:hypothetical protein